MYNYYEKYKKILKLRYFKTLGVPNSPKHNVCCITQTNIYFVLQSKQVLRDFNFVSNPQSEISQNAKNLTLNYWLKARMRDFAELTIIL